MSEISKKRFIAGAKCPSCSEYDKIFTYEKDREVWRACASCDFMESFSQSAAANAVEELPTRVNQQRLGEATLAHETPIEKVKFLDPKKT